LCGKHAWAGAGTGVSYKTGEHSPRRLVSYKTGDGSYIRQETSLLGDLDADEDDPHPGRK